MARTITVIALAMFIGVGVFQIINLLAITNPFIITGLAFLGFFAWVTVGAALANGED